MVDLLQSACVYKTPWKVKMPYHPRLEDQILTAFKQALAESRPDVAEYLLCALETLCREASFGSALAGAYFALDTKAATKLQP
jgi:hypothetical protein